MTKWVVPILHQVSGSYPEFETWVDLVHTLYVERTAWHVRICLISHFHVHIHETCRDSFKCWSLPFRQPVYLCEFKKCRDQSATCWLFSAPNTPNLQSSPSLTDTAAMTASTVGCEEMIGSKLVHVSWWVLTSSQSVKIQAEHGTSWNQTIDT